MELVVLGIIGLAVGSFINVLIDRLPRGEDILFTRSHCESCGKTLRWFELIPLISFVIQKGRCLWCRAKLSIQYPLVEISASAGFVLIGLFVGQTNMLHLMSYLVLFLCFFVIFVADSKYRFIPDSMVIVGIIAAVCLRYATLGSVTLVNRVPDYLVSAVGASLFFWGLHVLTRGRGMGFGDVKLAFLMGLVLGFPGIIIALYVAFLTGATVGVILILIGSKTLKSKVAFGPFLVLGTFVAMIWGNKLLDWWRALL